MPNSQSGIREVDNHFRINNLRRGDIFGLGSHTVPSSGSPGFRGVSIQTVFDPAKLHEQGRIQPKRGNGSRAGTRLGGGPTSVLTESAGPRSGMGE